MAVGSDEKSLVKLNRQVIQAIQAYNRTEAQWTDWTDHVFELEDINRWDFLQKVLLSFIKHFQPVYFICLPWDIYDV